MYNENGLRVQKTVNGVVTKYTLHGKNIVHMTQGNDELHFFYDAHNKPAIVVYNSVPYSYVKNLQGDVVALLNSAGAVVVSYVYDAWGRPISKTGTLASTLGTVQPFRYRGYVYDEETVLYYLESRYYAPSIFRFTNADEYVTTGLTILACNMFTYCENSVIMKQDPAGTDCICLHQRVNGNHVCYSEPENPHDESNLIMLYSEHSTNKTPSNRNPHEKGQTRRQRDARGEKGDSRRKKDRSNKRRNNTSNNTSKIGAFFTAVALLGGMAYIVLNDATGVGVADDAALAPMGALFLTNWDILFN